MTHFYDRRTGEMTYFPQHEVSGLRATGYDEDGTPYDWTVPTDKEAVPLPGDHAVRPDLVNNSDYVAMMHDEGYSRTRSSKTAKNPRKGK